MIEQDGSADLAKDGIDSEEVGGSHEACAAAQAC